MPLFCLSTKVEAKSTAGLTPVAIIKTSVGMDRPSKTTDWGFLSVEEIYWMLAEVITLIPFFSLKV